MVFKNKRILCTGGAGFVGSHLSKRLLVDGYEVHVLDRLRPMGSNEFAERFPGNYHRGDVNDYQSLERVFEEVKPELVIHLAGMVSRKECEETPTLAIQTNAGGTYNVCALSLRYGARLIYSGSSEEYGTALWGGAVVDEETPFGEPTGIYSMTKRMAEEIVRYHAFFKGLRATTMRIFMLYGPGEEPSEYRSALVRFMDWALRNQPLTVHVDTERAWCYIGDAVEAMKLLADRDQKENYEVFNIGRADPVPTEQLAEMIVKLCGSSSEIRRVEAGPTVIPVKRAQFKKAKQELGWEAETPLKEGLMRTMNWMSGA